MTRYTHIRRFSLLLCMTSLLLCGCRKSYPGMEYEEEKVQVNELYDDIPIMVAVNDPLMISANRGLGPLDDEDDLDAYEKWLKTKLYIYAFLTKNSVYDGPTDYAIQMDHPDNLVKNIDDPLVEPDKMYCLISGSHNDPNSHGREAFISPDQTPYISWRDNEILYYNHYHQDYKYNFFAYHLDDAVINDIKKEHNQIQLDLTINGSQDLMLGVASPTEDQIQKLCQDNKWTAARIKDLAYSTTTGHRDVVPVIAMRHMLSRFSFKLTGQDEESAKIRVRNVYVRSKNRGLMTVATDDTTRLGLTFPDELNPAEEKRPKLYLPIIENGEMQTNGFTQTYNVMFNESLVLGEDILLPSGETFTLVLECDQANDRNDELIHYAVGYKLALAEGKGFEPGVKYIVNVNVYGKQPISIMIDDVGWELSTVDINIGEEDYDPYLAPSHARQQDVPSESGKQ